MRIFSLMPGRRGLLPRRQQQFASVIGISQQSVNKYENHNIEPDIFTFCALADYFDISIDYLVGRVEEEDSPATYVLTPAEAKHIREYRKLDRRVKGAAESSCFKYN